MDIIERFIDERITKTNREEDFETSNHLFLDYKSFCAKNRLFPLEIRSFLDMIWKKLEFKKVGPFSYHFNGIKIQVREEYRKRSDIIDRFIDARIIKTNREEDFETFDNLFLNFKVFCAKNEIPLMERRPCSIMFMEKLKIKKIGSCSFHFTGIKLRDTTIAG